MCTSFPPFKIWFSDLTRLEQPVDCEDPDLWSVKSRVCYPLSSLFLVVIQLLKLKSQLRDAILHHALQAMEAEIRLHLVFFTPSQHDEGDDDDECKEGAIAILPAKADVKDPTYHRRKLPSEGLHKIMEVVEARTLEGMGLVEIPGDPELFVKLSYVRHGDDGARGDVWEEVIYGSMCLIATMRES